MNSWIRTISLFSALLLGFGAVAAAQDEARIGDLTFVDKQYMEQQRQSLEELVARNYGGRFKRQKDYDLRLLQKLLDDGLVRNDQTRELQAMGIVMGDLLAADLGLHWVIYEDRLGRSRALRYKDTENYLFPATMISRRREVDNRSSVSDIYQKAVDAISPSIPKLPFQ